MGGALPRTTERHLWDECEESGEKVSRRKGNLRACTTGDRPGCPLPCAEGSSEAELGKASATFSANSP